MRNRFGVLARAGLLAVSCLSIVSCSSGSGEEVAQKIPVGSWVSELDKFMDGSETDGEVIAWIPKVSPSPIDSTDHETILETGREISNEFGDFSERNLGNFEDWQRATPDVDRFTGEIRFVVANMAAWDVVSLIYVDGVLKSKDWGHLPG
jgi:hypothetical protein